MNDTCRNKDWMDREFREHLASVIIPTYNRAAFLRDTLESVRLQTYRPIEIVVVDDGSTDNTHDVVAEWYSQYRGRQLTLTYVRQSNSGAGAARNAGLQHAEGEFIQLLDSDDFLHPEKLTLGIELLKSERCQVVVPHVELFRDPAKVASALNSAPIRREFSRNKAPTRRPYLTALRWDSPIPTYRREVFRLVGPFREDIALGQTADHVMRVKVSGVRIHYTPFVLYYYRQGTPGALTSASSLRRTRCQVMLLESAISHLSPLHSVHVSEWRNIASQATKTAYRAINWGGSRETALDALFIAKRAASRSGLVWRASSKLPATLLLSSMRVVHGLRRLKQIVRQLGAHSKKAQQ